MNASESFQRASFKLREIAHSHDYFGVQQSEQWKREGGVGLKIGEYQQQHYAGKQGRSSVHTRFNLFLKILIDWDVTTEAPSVLQYFKAYSPNAECEFLERMPL